MGKTKTKALTAREQRIQDKRIKLATEALGWYGAGAIMFSYAFASFGVLSVQSTPYLILNFTGAIGILTVATAKHVRQSMLINAFWALMAGLALLRIVLNV